MPAYFRAEATWTSEARVLPTPGAYTVSDIYASNDARPFEIATPDHDKLFTPQRRFRGDSHTRPVDPPGCRGQWCSAASSGISGKWEWRWTWARPSASVTCTGGDAITRAGADPNAADVDDSLLLAMSSPKRDALVVLLRRYGANPKWSLIAAHNVKDAQVLMRMGADPNAPVGSDRETPLAYHCIIGNAELVRFLLKRGGDPTVRDEQARPSSNGWITPPGTILNKRQNTGR